MTEANWKRLEELSGLLNRNSIEECEYDTLLSMTMNEDEHPEWFNGSCSCKLCMSYV